MKRELRDKWVEALRSGNYAQTRGVLHQVKETMPIRLPHTGAIS